MECALSLVDPGRMFFSVVAVQVEGRLSMTRWSHVVVILGFRPKDDGPLGANCKRALI